MLKYVVDASVAIKWASQKREMDVGKARNLYKAMLEGKLELYTPTFLLVELLNILIWKKKASKRSVTLILKEIVEEGIRFIPLETNTSSIIKRFIYRYSVTAYDATYLAVAYNLNCKLITADKKLLQIRRLTVNLSEIIMI